MQCILNFFLNKGCIFFCQNQTPLIFLSVLINEFKTHKTHSDAHLKPTNVNEYAIEKSERWRSQNSLTVIASSRHHSQLNLPEKNRFPQKENTQLNTSDKISVQESYTHTHKCKTKKKNKNQWVSGQYVVTYRVISSQTHTLRHHLPRYIPDLSHPKHWSHVLHIHVTAACEMRVLDNRTSCPTVKGG